MTYLDHCRRAMLSDAQKGRPASLRERRELGVEWVVGRNAVEAVDSQLGGLFPSPEPEPAQRDLFK